MKIRDIEEAMRVMGFFPTIDASTYVSYVNTINGTMTIHINVESTPVISAYIGGKKLPRYKVPKYHNSLGNLIGSMELFINRCQPLEPISSAINTRNLAQKIARVKSSNIWGYTINVKDNKSKFGDVLVQFKDKFGGPGDVYIYYDVPVMLYRRWHSAASKGHFFWVYIRNNFKYSKLTGDKKGKLDNAVN